MSPSKNPADLPDQMPETHLVTAGRDPRHAHGFINTPAARGSTVLYPTADDIRNDRGEFQYGREGTPTTKALSDAIAALEGAEPSIAARN